MVDIFYQPPYFVGIMAVKSKKDSLLFGRRLRELRCAAGLSIKALAKEFGISYTYISRIETGRALPSKALTAKIATRLGADFEELLVLAGRLPDDIRLILYENPVEAPALLRESFPTYKRLARGRSL